MVQVDVFWSYGLGASFAAAAARQLRKIGNPFESKYFTCTLLFLSLVFAPSGIYLLWEFPHWETMQVATTWGDLPAWLVTTFAVTNVALGILGFYVSYWFIKKGRYYAAHIQYFLGYFCMFFILLYGWDGTGWQRFLYDATMHDGVLWSPGMHDGLGFLTSHVCFTLLGMGVVLVPALGLPMIAWIRKGGFEDESVPNDDVPGPVKTAVMILVSIFIVALGSAAVAGLLAYCIGNIMLSNTYLGIPVALLIFAVAGYFLLFRKPMPAYQVFKTLFIAEP